MDDTLQLRLQIATTNFHKQLLLGVGPDSVVDELAAVARSAKTLHNTTMTGDALDALGLVLHFKAFEDGNFDVASSAFKEAYALRKTSGDQRRLAESLFHLGLTYEHKAAATAKDKRKANAYYQKSLALARAGGDKLGMSYAYRHLGGLLQEAGKFDAALGLFKKSQELRREIGFVIYLAPATGAIGDVYMEMKQYPEAIGYFKQAYEQARDAGLSRFTTSYESRIRDAESKLGSKK
ncbi:MAG: tetratricopeptide repeat protein [Pseudomonadota bacterium]